MDGADERRWIEGWQAAGPELERQRARELRGLTPERALLFSDSLLSLARPQDVPERRRAHSGLVELQDLFRRLRSR